MYSDIVALIGLQKALTFQGLVGTDSGVLTFTVTTGDRAHTVDVRNETSTVVKGLSKGRSGKVRDVAFVLNVLERRLTLY